MKDGELSGERGRLIRLAPEDEAEYPHNCPLSKKSCNVLVANALLPLPLSISDIVSAYMPYDCVPR